MKTTFKKMTNDEIVDILNQDKNARVWVQFSRTKILIKYAASKGVKIEIVDINAYNSIPYAKMAKEY